jgi:hypothetical protein
MDDFTDSDLYSNDQKLVRHHRRSVTDPASKAPSLINECLDNDDWHVITRYFGLLKPLKKVTMNLPGNVRTAAKQEQPVRGAIWQVSDYVHLCVPEMEGVCHRVTVFLVPAD